MTRRLVAAMVALVAAVAIALAVPMASVVATSVRSAFVSGLEVDTLATATAMAAEPSVDWQATAEEAAARTGARVVVVSPSLQLVADSDNSSLDRDFDRPEIQQALAGSLTADVRPSATLGQELRFVAAPVVQDYGIVAAVRLSMPEATVADEVRATAGWLVLFVVSVAVAAGIVAWLIARSMAAPLDRVAKVAGSLADDLDARADETAGPREVRQVAAALNATASRLGRMLQRTQRVAADASHHLRTPLTGVRLRLEAIDDISDDAQVREQAEAAMAEVDRLNRRIDQVLALARTDAGEGTLVDEDVSAVVAARAAEAVGLFEERALVLSAEIEDGCRARVPAGLVARLVDELLGNAMSYARSGVRVQVRRDGTEVVLTVSDDGPGLPAQERGVVFERFRRGESAVPGGSGLGLALVRESVEALGGSAVAVPADEGGLRVEVRLPA